MSRRDIVVNTLLGLLLVSVFALPFFLGIAILPVVLKGAGLAIASFWPKLAHPQNAAILVLIALCALTPAVVHSRKRRWRNAFLSFAALPMILSIWFADAHSSFGLNGDYWIVILLVAFSSPPDSAPTRFHFFAAACAISAVVAVNTGLLGYGLIARIVSDCVFAGLFIWFVVDARRNWNGTKDPGPQAPLSPTSA
jgi:hypothetical protein